MFYYQVWVRSNKYHSKEPLTYSYDKNLNTGTIIRVFLQNNEVNGLVIGKIQKPRFKTKKINYIYKLEPININLIKLIKWLINYYPSNIGVLMTHILPLKIDDTIKQTNNKKRVLLKSKLPNLTEDQKIALESIVKGSTSLIKGRTGSGKTRIYLELAKKSYSKNQSSIILTPEISLTSQLFKTFDEQFKGSVFVVHSRLNPKEKLSIWTNCLLSKKPIILIGPRSALLYPINNLGLIVIDEVHESSYKEEQQPYYQAIRLASKLSKLSRANLLLGSATPNITDYYLAINKKATIIKLDKLAINSKKVENNVQIIDLKDRSNFNNSNLISDSLIDSLTLSLSRKEQSLIYLNRRGTARIIFCSNCGWEKLCKNCNLPLAYHADKQILICHTCGYKEYTMPSICSNCGNSEIIYKSAGTKAVYEEIARLFPLAKLARFDSDNKRGESFHNLYGNILKGKIDILIGTQTIAKGLDLPKLSTVGLVQADTSLYIPDYTSKERTFQLISQVLGRINRGHVKGKAVIQTYNVDSKLITWAINSDYESFYQDELSERKSFKFPPFFNLLKLTNSRASLKTAEKSALELKHVIENQNLNIIIEGPSPAFHEKYQNKYHWQLVIKSSNRSNLVNIITTLPANWSYNLDPNNLL